MRSSPSRGAPSATSSALPRRRTTFWSGRSAGPLLLLVTLASCHHVAPPVRIPGRTEVVVVGLPGAPWAEPGRGPDADSLARLLRGLAPELVLIDVSSERIATPSSWDRALRARPDAAALIGPLRTRFGYDLLSVGDRLSAPQGVTDFAARRAQWTAEHPARPDTPRGRTRELEQLLQSRHGDDAQWWLDPEARQVSAQRWTIWMREADPELGEAALSKSFEREYNSVAEILQANPGRRVLVAVRFARAWALAQRLEERRPADALLFDARRFLP